nr:type II toxin-antitoxin system HicB family antitoxin [Mycobacterium terramassiliense]
MVAPLPRVRRCVRRAALPEARGADRATGRRRRRGGAHRTSGEPARLRRLRPTPLSERGYSGTFSVRTSPELHARLALEAVEQGVSMNQWIVQKLSGRSPSDTFGLSGFD